MSLHKLAEVTITVYGLPEHCGTDDKLQELTEEAEVLVESLGFVLLLNQMLVDAYPRLADKLRIEVKGIHQ